MGCGKQRHVVDVHLVDFAEDDRRKITDVIALFNEVLSLGRRSYAA